MSKNGGLKRYGSIVENQMYKFSLKNDKIFIKGQDICNNIPNHTLEIRSLIQNKNIVIITQNKGFVVI